MKLALCMLLAPAIAHAEIAHPEELMLGELASLQDAAELQLTARPTRTRDHWESGLVVEYGITRRLQLSLEGSLDQRELELQALVGAIQREHIELAVGSSVSLEGEVEPIASLLVGNRRGGVNLAVTGSSELEAGATFAVFARLKRVTPMLEVGYRDELACRGGFALKLGSVELSSAIGYGSMTGPSAHAALTWEIELAEDDR